MLTDEDRQRIEAEERKRLAEEQYRSEIRSKLQTGVTSTTRHNPVLWISGVIIVIVAGLILLNNRSQSKTDDSQSSLQGQSNPTRTPKMRQVPVSQKIATGQITVKAGGYVQYRMTITPDMIEPIVSGSFNASGGSGNDIAGIIADEENYTNWINGHQARVFWGTAGKETTGTFQVKLPSGVYYLVLSNKFSVFTDKQVFLDIDLNYKRAETYY